MISWGQAAYYLGRIVFALIGIFQTARARAEGAARERAAASQAAADRARRAADAAARADAMTDDELEDHWRDAA